MHCQESYICYMKRGCAVLGNGVQYDDRCAFPGEPHLLYKEMLCIVERGCAVLGKGVEYDERVCITRRATFATRREAVHCRERVCSTWKGCTVS